MNSLLAEPVAPGLIFVEDMARFCDVVGTGCRSGLASFDALIPVPIGVTSIRKLTVVVSLAVCPCKEIHR